MQKITNKNKREGMGITHIFGVLMILVLLAGAAYFWRAKNSIAITQVVSGEYQAVFLDNGQTYFGKVSNKESVYVKLTDVYYLQADGSEKSDLALVKLGSELHGPEDEMEILRNHILFIENLAADSKVAQAIVTYKNKEL